MDIGMELDTATSDLNTPTPSTVPASKDDDPPSRPSPTASPEDKVKCAICLGDLVNRSYSNSCIHQFCFGCLLEWSKVKPECPLCKSTFRVIYHNIRSNVDFDEYVVPTPPTPIPSLSIRVSSGRSDRSPELLITRGNHEFELPNYGGFHYRTPPLFRDPRVYRLQLGQFGSSRNDAIDVLLHGHHGHSSHYPPPHPSSASSVFHENPFNDDPPEFFGGILDLAARAPYNHSTRFSGYQSRRRRYDRNQWVAPFSSTLMVGTVFFPSVEYFQQHPGAIRRISTWLHRELTVLMSLASSRTQMAYTYDLVISLLLRYDIRSQDFRDLLRPYLGAKTKQFQHEFYHYVLSGMRMEEFDNVAQYHSTGGSSSAVRPGENPHNVQPAVVTIDSDDDTPEIVIDDDDPGTTTQSSNHHRPRRSPGRTHSSSRRNGGSSRRGHESRHRSSGGGGDNHSSSRPLNSGGSFNFPSIDISSSESTEPFNASRLDIVNAFNEIDTEVQRLRNIQSSNRSSRRSPNVSRDPEMPILEPQVDLNNLSSSGTPNVFRRARDTEPTTTSRHMWDFINDVDISDILDERPGRRFMDLEPDGSSYPRIPHHETDMHNLLGFSAPRENRPLGSPDFPILQIRENRERRHREQQQQGQHNLAENGHTSTSSTSMERPSCIHSSNTNTNNGSVQIRIYPTAVDLSPFGLNLSNNRSRSPAGAARPRTPGRPPSPMMPDDGECEFLGVHPIVKKPPLAVITLSSEDENEDGNHNQTSLQTDNVIDVDPIPGTSTNLMPLSALPFKRRYVAPPPELDAFQAALSALPTANLVERHMDSIPPFRQRHSSKHKKKERYRNPAFELHSSPPHKSKKQSSEIESLESTGWSRAAASAKKRKQSVTASKSSLTGKKKTVNTRSTKVKPWLLVEPSASSSPSMNSGTELKLDSSADSDSDFDVFASRIKSKKQKSPKKKTKKSKKSSKCKSKKGSKRSSSRTMSSSMLKPEKHATSSTFTNNPALSGSSSNRLKSVVMKVNKGKKSSKIKLTPSLIFTSSESSSSDEKTCRSVMFDGGMVASSSGSLTTASSSSATTIVGGTSGSSQSQEIQTPSSALDLSSTGTNSNHLSPFLGPISTSIMKRRILSRRWESDDDDNDEQEDKILISENNDEASDSGSVGRFNEHQDDPDNSDDSDFSIAHHGSRNHKRLRIDGDDDDF